MTSKHGQTAGSLVIVGTGIQVNGQTTPQVRECIERADKVFYAVANRAAGYWISTLNPNAEALERFYQEGQDRLITYREIVEYLLSHVRAGLKVCGAFYGHAGVFAWPSHEAIRRARLEGYAAWMMPGISAEDCLLADLAGDPTLGMFGYQCFEATDFLIHRRRFDPHSALILWQVGVIANPTHERHYAVRGLAVLSEALSEWYPADHPIVLYEAAQYPICQPVIERMALRDLPQARVSAVSTLYIPRVGPCPPDPEMMARLGISN